MLKTFLESLKIVLIALGMALVVIGASTIIAAISYGLFHIPYIGPILMIAWIIFCLTIITMIFYQEEKK